MADTGGTGTPRRRSWVVRRVMLPAEDWLVRNSTKFTVTSVLLLLAFGLLSPLMLYNIPPGQVGVIWRRFGGTDVDRYLMEGLQIVWPWDKIYKYDTRLRREERDFQVLSEDGLAISVRIAWRFSLNARYVPLLHQFIGPHFTDVLLAPDIAERARDAFAGNKPEEIWTNRRDVIQREILSQVRQNLRNNFQPPGLRNVDFINLDDVLVTGLTLPLAVQHSIESKNVENQRQQEMDYRLLYEHKEAERKTIEAAGIRQFQDVVNYGLTDSYLKWRGIEATLKLAESHNAKVVVIGNSANGLPLILGGGIDKETTPPAKADGKTSERAPLMLPSNGKVVTPAEENRAIAWLKHVWTAVKEGGASEPTSTPATTPSTGTPSISPGSPTKDSVSNTPTPNPPPPPTSSK